MFKFIIAALALFPASVAHAQAFGVRGGGSITQYSGRLIDRSTSPYVFEITVPTPNGEFESYMATATPETGVCKVSGLGRTHRNDSYGTNTKRAYQALKTALRARYGASKDFDFIVSNALWKDSNEWVWSIYKEERYLASFWDIENGSTLPTGVTSVTLEVKAISSTSPYITLRYEFDNIDRCLKIVSDKESQGL